MTQPTTIFYTSPSLFKKETNKNNNRPSRVREVIRKFDMLEKSNGLSSSSVPSYRSSSNVVQINQTNNNKTFGSSSSSSMDSTTTENGIEEQVSTPEADPLVNRPHISTAITEIRPPLPKRIRAHRIVPTIPVNIPKPKQNEEPVYVNSDNTIENNHYQSRKFSDVSLDDKNQINGMLSSTAYPKLMINQPFSSRLRTDSYRNGIEQVLPSSIQNRSKNSDADSIGLEIDPSKSRYPPSIFINGRHMSNNKQRFSTFSTNYETTEIAEQPQSVSFSSRHTPPPIPPSPRPPFKTIFREISQQDSQDDLQIYTSERTLPISNFLLEIGAFVIVFIVCMVLVSAIREDETNLGITMQITYSYIYLVSIIWMIWCTFDIIEFRRKWMNLTANVRDHEEYMVLTERHLNQMFYFPDVHNTGGLFMRVGAGLLCMGGLILTVIQITKTIARIESGDAIARANLPNTDTYTSAVTITKLITYIFRFVFHCIQFSFLFRYGNLVVNHYHLLARIGLIHIIIANFCTWFEAIVIETLEQMHNTPNSPFLSTSNLPYSTTNIPQTMSNTTFNDEFTFNFLQTLEALSSSSGSTDTNRTILEIIYEIESTMAIYLYPCLIEYSLISLTVFFIMWKNVGKETKRSFLHFSDRNVFTINCARASRGLLIGGIILLLTVVTLISTYLFDEQATSISQITGLVLILVSLCTVGLSYIYTTKLFYDHHAHVDIFDQALILITTVGDFAYSMFRLFASIFSVESERKLPYGLEISIGIFAILQTFLQSAFIMDTLKRRTRTKQEIRKKPGREMITALLLMNLTIWLHDSLSAKKVRLNPSQVAYYNVETWAIIQAFTSPLSIFYRFHSSVCLADIWQDVYRNHRLEEDEEEEQQQQQAKHSMIPLVSINGGHDNF